MAGIETKVDDEGARTKLENANELIQQAIKSALLALALKTQYRAQMKTPVEYGKLRASAFVKMEPNKATVSVGFSADYAEYVHDNTDEKLRGEPRTSGLGTYWNPGESEFLKKAVEETRPEVKPTIQQFIDRALEEQ